MLARQEASLDGKALFDRPSGAGSGGHREGQSRRAAARRYDVSASFVVKLADRVSRTGSAQPAPQGRPPGGGKLAPYLGGSTQVVDAEPDITMPGTGGQIESREGCDGASGVVVAGAAEGGPVRQEKHRWPPRPSARTCARRVTSGRRGANYACARRSID